MRKLVVLVPKIVGMASMLGSSYIVYCLTGTERARQEKLKTTFHRFLLLLSLYDIVSSFGMFLSTWAVPADPPQGMEEVVKEKEDNTMIL